jgi:hypothetical protein
VKRPARSALAFAIVCAGIVVAERLAEARQQPGSGAGRESRAPSPESFTFERPAAATAPGPQRLTVDEPLVIGGNPFRVLQRGRAFVAVDGLSDLRLFDPTGKPIPYLLVHPPLAEPRWVTATPLPTPATKKTSGFEADFRQAQSIDMVRVEGIPAPFLKRVAVEGSGDRSRWTSLAAEATLFDLPTERLRQVDIAFTPGAYRYIRVTWDDTNSARVPPPRAAVARLTARDPVAPPPPIDLPLERQTSEPGLSRYRIRLPAPRLPLVGVELDVDGGHVFRTAAVTESRFAGSEAAPVELGRATLSRVVRDGVQAADLRVPITQPIETEIQLTIDDGDNPPLEVQRVRGTFAQLPAIYVEVAAGELVARYGNRTLRAPTYDLEAVRESVDVSRVPQATWGNARRLVETEPVLSDEAGPGPGGPIDLSRFEFTRSVVNVAPGLATLTLDAAVLSGSAGPNQRFADVRLVDENSRQIPYLVERRDEPLQIDLTLSAAQPTSAELKSSSGRQLSFYSVTLPYADLPAGTLVFETAARVFQRKVRLGIEQQADRRRRDPWFDEIASAPWRHADRQATARPLSLRIDRTDRTDLLLVVDEGDNAPLPITSVKLLLPKYRLRFYYPATGSVRLGYGRDDLQAPQYDLALLAQQVMGAAAREATLAPDASAERERSDRRLIAPVTFWILLGGAVLVLIGIIARLVRS